MEILQDKKDDELVRQLFRTTRLFSRTLNSVVIEHGLHSAEWMVLHVVQSHGGISQAELTSYFNVEAAAITRTLSRLEKKGYLFRSPLPKGKGRGKYIELTKEGQQLFHDLDASVRRHRRRALSGFSEEERQVGLRLLLQLQNNLTTK